VNLRAMATMQDAFGVPVGYSDHTMGSAVALAAVALGACLLEKHFTLDRNLPGPDHKASLEPDELSALIRGVRIVEDSLGSGLKEPTKAERVIAVLARKKLVAATNLEVGERLGPDMLRAQRAGPGLLPNETSRVVGCFLRRAVRAGTALQEADITAQSDLS